MARSFKGQAIKQPSSRTKALKAAKEVAAAKRALRGDKTGAIKPRTTLTVGGSESVNVNYNASVELTNFGTF